MDSKISAKLETFFTQFKHQKFRKGEILVRADENPSGIFYLKDGIVKKYIISQKGDELVVNIFKPISFFPMSWGMNGTPNQYFYEAAEDCEIWKAPAEKVVAFLKENPDVMYDLLSRVYIGTEGLLMRLAYLMSGNAYSRLITELIITAKRFGKKHNDNSIECTISEKDLAAQAGMSRETVSREIKLLKDKGFVIFTTHTLIIKNLTALEEELAADF